MDQAPGETTVLLKKVQMGDAVAKERLAEIVYEELRRIARRYMQRERRDHTLQATVLVHEAFVRLIEDKHHSWQKRAHFIGTAARVMRRILVDYARRHATMKRGAGQHSAPLEAAVELFSKDQAADLVALDEALERLKALNARQAQIVDMRYFGGLTVEETGEAIGVSAETVKKDWAAARAWLFGQLHGKSSV